MSMILGIVMLALPTMAAEIPAGSVVLTVAGNIARVNRSAYDADRDMFFRHHQRTFATAFVFDRAMLESLGVKTIHVTWAGPKVLTGTRLVDVLDATGCQERPVDTLALDGFRFKADTEAREWIVATRADGWALGIGDRGPLWPVTERISAWDSEPCSSLSADRRNRTASGPANCDNHWYLTAFESPQEPSTGVFGSSWFPWMNGSADGTGLCSRDASTRPVACTRTPVGVLAETGPPSVSVGLDAVSFETRSGKMAWLARPMYAVGASTTISL